MKRNSTTVFIESANAITPIPWVSNAPDFTDITEPTLSILKAAYEQDKGSITVIPDPVITTPAIDPNPQGFLKACFNPANTDLFAIFTQVFGTTFSNVTASRWYDQMVAGSSDGLFVLSTPSYSGGFGLALNQLASTVGLTAAQKTAIRTALVTYGLPSDII